MLATEQIPFDRVSSYARQHQQSSPGSLCVTSNVYHHEEASIASRHSCRSLPSPCFVSHQIVNHNASAHRFDLRSVTASFEHRRLTRDCIISSTLSPAPMTWLDATSHPLSCLLHCLCPGRTTTNSQTCKPMLGRFTSRLSEQYFPLPVPRFVTGTSGCRPCGPVPSFASLSSLASSHL